MPNVIDPLDDWHSKSPWKEEKVKTLTQIRRGGGFFDPMTSWEQ